MFIPSIHLWGGAAIIKGQLDGFKTFIQFSFIYIVASRYIKRMKNSWRPKTQTRAD